MSVKLCSLQKKNYIYEEFQTGFRPHPSTETALLSKSKKKYFLLALEQSCLSLLVLLDLSVAFDTIDQDILIDLLQNYTGIQEQALRWFRSYLSDHYNFVYLVISIITSKVWSTTRIFPRSSAIFNIHVAPW